MRVLHVITGLAEGGAEHQLRLLLPRLPYECEVVTLSHPGAVAAAIRAGGTTVHELSMTSNRDVSVCVDLRRLMRAGRFDLVHTHLYRACVHGRVAARLAGVPHVVATEHSLGDGLIEGRRTSPGVRGLYLATERLGQATIAVSATVAERLRAWGVPGARISVIGNGIDPGEFRFDPGLRSAARERLGIAPDAVVIGGVGRLAPTKRFDQLVTALRELPGATLLLVGAGPCRPELERLAAALGVGDRVVFAGAVGHTRDLLCAMDVFGSPSQQETFGLAVLEALACGLPAVYAVCPPLDAPAATATPGVRRMTGDPRSLAQALRAEVAALKARGGTRLGVPAVVTRHDIAQSAGSVAQLYERVAGRRRRRPASLLSSVESKGPRG